MHIRLLTESDAPDFLTLRLQALEREPRAFSSAPEDERARTPEDRAALLNAEVEGSFVLGAFTKGALVGVARLTREDSPKVRHKAMVQSMYVDASTRGQGVGRALLADLIARARTYPGLEQLILGVSTTQAGARALYKSFGFEPFGLEPHALKVGNEYVDEEYLILKL